MLDTLTDEQLVHAWDAVEAVTNATSATVSGKARLRLLAGTVADARGAQVALEKALAETVGKRLQRQADRVRQTLAAAAADAEEARASACSAAASDAALMANLPAELERINDTVLDARQKAHEVVYVGFPELDTLITPPPSVVPTESEACVYEVSGTDVSTQTECQPEAVVSSLSSARLGGPDDWRGVPALLQSAMDHIITLDARLAGVQGENDSLRAQVASARCRVDEERSRASEAEMLHGSAERQLLRHQETEADERVHELEDELAESQIDADMLRKTVSELQNEVYRLSRRV